MQHLGRIMLNGQAVSSKASTKAGSSTRVLANSRWHKSQPATLGDACSFNWHVEPLGSVFNYRHWRSSMKHSDDIANLFKQFGAKADPYLEIAREQEYKHSSERWPLVSAVKGAVSDDVPTVNRRAGSAFVPSSRNVPASPVVLSEPAGWLSGAVSTPMAASPPNPVVMPVQSKMVASPASDSHPAPQLDARSPLAGLAGLRTATAVSAQPVVHESPLNIDLPSVFAGLAGAVATGGSPARPAVPSWQPRKDHS